MYSALSEETKKLFLERREVVTWALTVKMEGSKDEIFLSRIFLICILATSWRLKSMLKGLMLKLFCWLK